MIKLKREGIDSNQIKDLTIGIKTQHFLTSYNSSYFPLFNSVELAFFPNIDTEAAFKILIGDVDHEVTHHIIKELVNSESSRTIDNSTLQSSLHIGFNTEKQYLDIVKQIWQNDFSY